MSIYTITAIEKIEFPNMIPDFGDIRAVGYYSNLEKAEITVINNMCDIHETMYDYVVIEKVDEGIYEPVLERWFYKYNLEVDCYEKIDEPKTLEHISNFALG